MQVDGSGNVVLDSRDVDRLSKLIEWTSQFVVRDILVQDAANFIQDWKLINAVGQRHMSTG